MEGTVYDKLRKLKESLRKSIGSVSDLELYQSGGRLECWHYPKKRKKGMKISKKEAMIYEFYMNNGYHPSTVYKWMLACNTNKDMQRKIKNGKLSFRKAIRMARPYKKLTETEAEFLYQVKMMIKKYVIR